MNSNPVVGAVYRHYKGNLYRVLYLAKHTETMEDLVVYVNVNEPEHVWARPASMWNDPVGDTVRFLRVDG